MKSDFSFDHIATRRRGDRGQLLYYNITHNILLLQCYNDGMDDNIIILL